MVYEMGLHSKSISGEVEINTMRAKDMPVLRQGSLLPICPSHLPDTVLDDNIAEEREAGLSWHSNA